MSARDVDGWRGALADAFRSLRHLQYRIFFAGQTVSLIGSWMQIIATSWLVYRLSESAFWLGVAAAAQQLPILLLSPVAGVWAERANRRRLLIGIQALAGLQALVMAALTFTGLISVPLVVALAFAIGAINAFETPVRQAFLLELVADRRDLPNAIALQSVAFQAARFIGPALAGLLLATAGEAWCFLANALSYAVIVAAYMRIRTRPRTPPPAGGSWLERLAEGLRHGFGYLGTRRILQLLAAVSLFASGWSSLMPLFAAEVFAGDSRLYGFMVGAVGVGAMAGGGWLAMRGRAETLGRVVAASTLTAGAALAGFALSRTLALSFVLLAVFGFGLILTAASCNTLLQTLAEEDKRARVISLYVTMFMGMMPIGNFASGTLAEMVGAPGALLAGGLLLLGTGALFSAGLPAWQAATAAVFAQRAGAEGRGTERPTSSS